MDICKKSFDSTDESGHTGFTRRTAVAGGLAALAGCLNAGSSRGIADILIYNPRGESREVSITVSDGAASDIETTVTVPASGSIDLKNSVVVEQTVTATVSDDTREASTEWDVQGSLYVDVMADGIEFRRESEVDTPRIIRPDGETDIVVSSHTKANMTVRVDKGGQTAFERTRSFPKDTRTVFHDRFDAAGSATVTVVAEDGREVTETMSVEDVVTVLATLDEELFLDRNFAG